MRTNTRQTRQSSGTTSNSNQKLARALGWFSIGLGLAELFAPRALARLTGIPATAASKRTLQVLGAREVIAGVIILARPGSPAPVWNRVAGDAIDLSLLGRAFALPGANKTRL